MTSIQNSTFERTIAHKSNSCYRRGSIEFLRRRVRWLIDDRYGTVRVQAFLSCSKAVTLRLGSIEHLDPSRLDPRNRVERFCIYNFFFFFLNLYSGIPCTRGSLIFENSTRKITCTWETIEWDMSKSKFSRGNGSGHVLLVFDSLSFRPGNCYLQQGTLLLALGYLFSIGREGVSAFSKKSIRVARMKWIQRTCIERLSCTKGLLSATIPD